MRGFYLTEEEIACFAQDIDEMSAMYADETRDDWWDADDIARDVAERLGSLIAIRI